MCNEFYPYALSVEESISFISKRDSSKTSRFIYTRNGSLIKSNDTSIVGVPLGYPIFSVARLVELLPPIVKYEDSNCIGDYYLSINGTMIEYKRDEESDSSCPDTILESYGGDLLYSVRYILLKIIEMKDGDASCIISAFDKRFGA